MVVVVVVVVVSWPGGTLVDEAACDAPARDELVLARVAARRAVGWDHGQAMRLRVAAGAQLDLSAPPRQLSIPLQALLPGLERLAQKHWWRGEWRHGQGGGHERHEHWRGHDCGGGAGAAELDLSADGAPRRGHVLAPHGKRNKRAFVIVEVVAAAGADQRRVRPPEPQMAVGADHVRAAAVLLDRHAARGVGAALHVLSPSPRPKSWVGFHVPWRRRPRAGAARLIRIEPSGVNELIDLKLHRHGIVRRDGAIHRLWPDVCI